MLDWNVFIEQFEKDCPKEILNKDNLMLQMVAVIKDIQNAKKVDWDVFDPFCSSVLLVGFGQELLDIVPKGTVCKTFRDAHYYTVCSKRPELIKTFLPDIQDKEFKEKILDLLKESI